MNPNVYIIAGPNGSGKTTFARQFLPLYAKCKNFVNADLIAEGIAPFAPESAAIRSGRIVLDQIHNFAAQMTDFSFESTLSGKSYVALLKHFKSKDYLIHIFFLWIPDVNLALSRIKERVAQGGHNVSAKDVVRRFGKSLKNFFNDYKPLADHWSIIDNSIIQPRVIARGEFDKVEIADNILYQSILKRKDSL